MSTDCRVELTVNGRPAARTVESRTNLADFLRDDLELTGTRLGCEHGVCGACTVLLDGEPVRSCIILAAQADGHEVTTVEGLEREDGSLSDVQEAFCATHALQCGYCTSGMVLATHALLDRVPRPDRAQVEEALGANICRCTGYQQIREAVDLAAAWRASTGQTAGNGTDSTDSTDGGDAATPQPDQTVRNAVSHG